jgi:hypothetical protein
MDLKGEVEVQGDRLQAIVLKTESVWEVGEGRTWRRSPES